jgi:hypothetical protein
MIDLTQIEKMQIIVALNDTPSDAISGDELLKRAENFEQEMQGAKAVLKGYAIVEAMKRYESRFGDDAGLDAIEALKW